MAPGPGPALRHSPQHPELAEGEEAGEDEEEEEEAEEEADGEEKEL